MKTTVAILMTLASLVSLNASARSVPPHGALDGKQFCREVQRDGLFGQPKGIMHHCVSFERGFARDNANTFFGNPPESYRYGMDGDSVMNLETGEDSGYVVVGNTLVIAETQAVLTRTK